MPTPDTRSGVAAAIDAIRAAEVLLTVQIRSADDALVAIKLTHEYNNLDSFLSTLLHLQNMTDDAALAAAASSFKATADTLKTDQAAITKIVDDVKLAAKIVSAIGKAITIIAKF